MRSLAVLRERLRDQAARTPAGAWIRVCGLDPNAIKECAAEQRSLTRWDIDDVTADHPTLLALWDGHSCIVNSRALALSGLDASPLIPSADIWGERPVANWTAISSTCPPCISHPARCPV